MNQLTKAMRTIGVAAMLLSGAVFLFQGIKVWDELTRFFMFSAMTVGVAALGVFCIRKLQEPIGARIFVALAAAATPGLFAQVAAMIYSTVNVDKLMVPEMFQFGGQRPLVLLAVAACALLVGLFVSHLGFSTLDRPRRADLTSAYLVMNLILLFPARDSVFALAAVLLSGAFALYLTAGGANGAGGGLAVTDEQRQALALLHLPALILLVRACFYSGAGAYDFEFPVLCFWVASFARSIGLGSERSQKFALYAFLAGLILVTLELTGGSFKPLPVAAVILAVHVALRSLERWRVSEALRLMSPLWMMGSTVLGISAMFNNSFFTAFLVAGISCVGLVEGYNLRSRDMFRSAVVLGVLSILLHLCLAVVKIDIFHWVYLAVIGGVVLVTASYLESRASRVRELMDQLSRRFE